MKVLSMMAYGLSKTTSVVATGAGKVAMALVDDFKSIPSGASAGWKSTESKFDKELDKVEAKYKTEPKQWS